MVYKAGLQTRWPINEVVNFVNPSGGLYKIKMTTTVMFDSSYGHVGDGCKYLTSKRVPPQKKKEKM